MDHGRLAGVVAALDDLAHTLAAEFELEPSQLLAQPGEGHQQVLGLRSAGATTDLVGRIGLEHDHAAGS